MIGIMLVIIGIILLAIWISSMVMLGAGFMELAIFKNETERKEIKIVSMISLIAFIISTYFLFFFKI